MKISENGINLIKKYEGYRGSAYQCAAGVWTIGWGTTVVEGKSVYPGMTCTQVQATEWLRSDLNKFEDKVNKYDSIYHFNQNQFDALVSFAYNIGSIDQLTNKGTRSLDYISEVMLAYCKAGGRVLEGLRKRRIEEQTLFNTAVVAVPKAPLKKGSQGCEVKILQHTLNHMFNLTLVEDGIFGSKTEYALINWKKLHHELCTNGYYCDECEDILRGDLK